MSPRLRKRLSAASLSATQFTPRDGTGELVLLWDGASLLGVYS